MPGKRVKGVVLAPDGKPAARAEVALQLTEGPFNLSLGPRSLISSGLQEHGLHVNVGKDGSFDLPLYEKAVAVVAVSESGFAHVSLEALKQSSPSPIESSGPPHPDRLEGPTFISSYPDTLIFYLAFHRDVA